MEQALFITKTDHTHYLTGDFSRLYFGNEFCEKLIPGQSELEEALSCAASRGVPFTYVTPYVTDRGLSTLEQQVLLFEKECPGTEVVFNDWGVFQLLREKAPGLIPVLGRLLHKSKRGPRIMNIIDKVPPPTRRYFTGSVLDVPAAVTFLKDRGIYRVECDNLLQGLDFGKADRAISRSLYLPFAFVSTTRFCLSARCDRPDMLQDVGISPCSRECRKYYFTLQNPVMRVPLIRKGNTIFFVNDTIPDVIEKRLVDRIVIAPEIPV